MDPMSMVVNVAVADMTATEMAPIAMCLQLGMPVKSTTQGAAELKCLFTEVGSNGSMVMHPLTAEAYLRAFNRKLAEATSAA